MVRAKKSTVASLALSIAFAIYHLVAGLLTGSWWLLTLASYYLVLSVVRFVVLRSKSNGQFITEFTGGMLMLLSVSLIGTAIMAVVQDRGHKLHMIVMIAIAAHAFAIITLAIVKLIKARRSRSAVLTALRNVSLAEALASIFALQRSMLVSFDGMSEGEIIIMNASLGSAVCVSCFLLGLRLLVKGKKDKYPAS